MVAEDNGEVEDVEETAGWEDDANATSGASEGAAGSGQQECRASTRSSRDNAERQSQLRLMNFKKKAGKVGRTTLEGNAGVGVVRSGDGENSGHNLWAHRQHFIKGPLRDREQRF